VESSDFCGRLFGWMQVICLQHSYLVHPRHVECFLTRNLEKTPSQKRHQLEKVGTKPLEVLPGEGRGFQNFWSHETLGIRCLEELY